MWFFKKKASEPVDLSWLGTDMHSHLLPGIDDGSQKHGNFFRADQSPGRPLGIKN